MSFLFYRPGTGRGFGGCFFYRRNMGLIVDRAASCNSPRRSQTLSVYKMHIHIVLLYISFRRGLACLSRLHWFTPPIPSSLRDGISGLASLSASLAFHVIDISPGEEEANRSSPPPPLGFSFSLQMAFIQCQLAVLGSLVLMILICWRRHGRMISVLYAPPADVATPCHAPSTP